jgi:hypothetical protein
MIDWSPRPPLDGNTAPRIGVDGMVASGDANSDFRATSLAMVATACASQLRVIIGVRPWVAARVSPLSPNVVQVGVNTDTA